MENVLHIECPSELLLGLHANAETMADIVKEETAVALFNKGKISSGLAAKWLDIPRVTFLLKAMEQGGALLEDSTDDFLRETRVL